MKVLPGKNAGIERSFWTKGLYTGINDGQRTAGSGKGDGKVREAVPAHPVAQFDVDIIVTAAKRFLKLNELPGMNGSLARSIIGARGEYRIIGAGDEGRATSEKRYENRPNRNRTAIEHITMGPDQNAGASYHAIRRHVKAFVAIR